MEKGNYYVSPPSPAIQLSEIRVGDQQQGQVKRKLGGYEPLHHNSTTNHHHTSLTSQLVYIFYMYEKGTEEK